ncbi:hypothetical protein [Chromobacterium subtsugae]|uniref:hypothetical protein n=1 Tax=Chromobacterium subtsugae TaxID=251747 RepID=UPI000ACA79E9|nr:hypothetical protein [Chromobacterium subtsugae]
MTELELASYVAIAGQTGAVSAEAVPQAPPASADGLAPIITQERRIPTRRRSQK